MSERPLMWDIRLWLGRRLIRGVPGYHVVQDIYGKRSRKLRDIRTDPLFNRIASRIIADRRSYLYYDRLFTLYQAVRNVSTSLSPEGKAVMIEVGAYRGGGTRFIAETARELLGESRVECFCVDTFEGHSEQDLALGREGVHTTQKFRDTGYESVCAYLACVPFVRVLKGRIQDVADQLRDKRFHLVHLDVDIYEPTSFSLQFFWGRLVEGGIMVLDDYGFTTCPGVERAVTEFLDTQKSRVGFQLLTGQYVLVKL